jgi:hypothetical protein
VRARGLQKTTLLLALLAAPALAADVTRIREVYVPYEEFRARVAGAPKGVVMQLDEYRALVLKALLRPEGEEPPLPPVAAAVTSARYEGSLSGKTVRLRATLSVRIAGDGWVRLDLGRPLPALGSVTVDGDPGWIIIEEAPPPPQAAPAGENTEGKGPAPAIAAPRAYLLLSGKGERKVEIVHSLAATEGDDRWSIQGQLIPAASSRVEIDVPGQVDATSDPPFLEVLPAGERSRLILAAGSAPGFKIEWRRRKAMGQSDALLAADHRISWFLREEGPVFSWDAVVSVARRKADSLSFAEPPGARVVRAEGPLVHAWERTPAGVRVVLSEAAEGEVRIRFSGILEATGGRFELGSPRLLESFADTGRMGLHGPGTSRLAVESVAAAEEVAIGEAELPPYPAGVGGAGATAPGPLERVFAFRSDDARVTASLALLPVRFEARAAWLLSAGETSAALEGAIRVTVTDGKLYRVSLSLPAPWRLASLAETPAAPEAARGIRHEEAGAPGSRTVEVFLARAAARGEPLDLRARFEHAAYGEERGWERKTLDLPLPAPAGAARSRTDLAVSIAQSMDAVMANLPGWRSLAPEEVATLGLDGARDGRTLAAGLTTEDAAPAIRFTLVHRPVRGEYRLVLSLIALERQVRGRADIQVAAVDRPIEELEIRLPPAAVDGAVILGDGIKDSRADAAAGARVVRFSRPWLGTRQLRVEYEVPHQAGAVVPIPSVEVRPGAAGGTLNGERFVLLQSRGPVEIETTPGPGLVPATVDDLPDFAEPWAEGRVLTAFRFRSAGDPGTLRTLIHARAPVLPSLARETRLTTVIGREGVSRTRAEILLAYSRAQSLTVRLPAGARPIAASVNGEPIRAVRPAAEGGRDVSIPLPPQSYATVVIVYERSDEAAGGGLGGSGTWEEEGPVFPEMPAGTTTWTVYHPPGYRFLIDGGNLEAVDPRDVEREGTFAGTLPGRLLRGASPFFTSFAREGSTKPLAAVPPLEAEVIEASAQDRMQVNGAQAARIEPAARLTERAAAPRYQLIPEGLKVEATKLGGGAVLRLAYREEGWGRSSRRAVFLATLLIGAFLWLRKDRRPFWWLVIGGFILTTLVPVALAWRSPLLAAPISEALAVLAAAGGIVLAVRWAASKAGRQPLAAPAAVAVAIVLAAAAGASADDAPPFPALDGVLIPYNPATSLKEPAGREKEVYVPDAKFRELWNLAHPESRIPDPPPADLVAGTAEYRLLIEGPAGRESFRMTGTVPVNVLTDRWVILPLPFERSRIVRLSVDGAAAGIGQGPREGVPGNLPFLELKGRGKRRIEIEIAGPVARDLGALRATTEVLAGAGATVRAELPPGARVEARNAAGEGIPASVTAGAEATVAIVDLGLSRGVDIVWTFPKVEGDTGSQVESLSYTAIDLTFDGYAAGRRERVRVTGRPVESVTYRVGGGWRITEVAGPDVSEWALARGEDGAERLQVFFARPVSGADLRIRGRAALERSGPLATLSLAGAAREEVFVGLRHGGLRKFAPDVLTGMRRASRDELLRAFQLGDAEIPDRVYHSFGSGEGQSLAVEPVTGEVTVETDVLAVVETGRLLVTARSRLAVTGPGPIRFEVLLPREWTPLAASSPAMRSWEVVDAGATGLRLVVHFQGRAPAGTEVVWSAERTFGALPDSIDLPTLRPAFPEGITSRESQEIVLAASEDIDLGARDAARLSPVPLDSAERWAKLPPGTSLRFAFRAARAEAGAEPMLRVGVTRRPSQLGAAVISIARLSEDSLQVNARVIARVRRGARDRFRFRLPAGAELVSIETRNQRSRDVRATPAGIEVDIVLQSPASGEHAIDVSYRARREGGAAPTLLPITVLDGDARLAEVDQYAGVLQDAATFVSAASAQGLVAAEARDFPYLPEGISIESLRPTFRATALDWSLALAEEEIEVARGPAAVIELAEISTLVGGDGIARTRAAYTVRNRSLQFLLVEMPPGADLWGVALNGKPVAVGQDQAAPGAARRLRIPLEHVGSAALDLEVEIHYEESRLDLPAIRGSARLLPPRVIDTQVVETVWNVEFPDGYWVTLGGGNMREVAASVQHAKKVENLLGQLDKISKAASETDSSRVRARAAQEIRRLEQALGDSSSELVELNRSNLEAQRAEEIGKDDLQEQWAFNDALIERTRRAQAGLKEARDQEQKAPQQQAVQSKAEQQLQEAANYQKGAWLRNVQAPGAAEEPQAPAAQAGIDLDLLREGKPFRGLQGAPPVPGAPEAEAAAPKAVDGTKGLRPLPDLAGAGASPGLEAPRKETGRAPYTFLRSGGDAELVLSFTRKDVAPRGVALAALGLAAAAAVWLARRAARAA